MTIKGTLTKSEVNGYGYTTIWVQGTRYGSDKKGATGAQVGDTVEFEAFDKPSNKGDGKTWPTFQFQTFRKVAGAVADNGSSAQPGGAVLTPGAPNGLVYASIAKAAPGRDSYWADKAAEDGKKDPRISFYASYERAVQFVDLALRNGAFDALAKAKPTARLEVLQAFVSEQTLRIMGDAYSATVPSAKAAVKAEAKEAEATELESDPEENWS